MTGNFAAGKNPHQRQVVQGVSQHMKLCTGGTKMKATSNSALRNLIEVGRAKPSWIVSHELPLDQAPDVYKSFDERKDGWTKVVLKTGQ